MKTNEGIRLDKPGPHKSIRDVADLLSHVLEEYPWFIAVGIGDNLLYVYFQPPVLIGAKLLLSLARHGTEGFPITIVETTRPVPARSTP